VLGLVIYGAYGARQRHLMAAGGDRQ
jgi:hypothetical protein